MSKIRVYLLIVFILINVDLLGQIQIKNLLFNSTVNVTGLNFNTTTPKIFYTNTKSTSIGEGIAHMEDKYGNIIFYVNSSGVYDKYYTKMSGSTGIYANPSAAEINICPFVGDSNKYYLIYNKDVCSPLYYSIVDMTKRGGLGDVTTLNYMFDSDNYAEGLEIVVKEKGKSNWFLAYKCYSGIYRFLIDSAGIHQGVLIYSYSVPNTIHSQRFEMDYHNGWLSAAFNDFSGPLVAQFDNKKGIISNVRFITPPTKVKFYGVEFSPNLEKVYFSMWYNNLSTNLFQYNLSDLKLSNSWFIKTNGIGIGQIELAPNGNLYIPHHEGTAITGIVNPDNSNPTINTINVNYKLSLGVSDFIQSTVYIPDVMVENTCFGSYSNFSFSDTSHIDSVLWNFGDISTGAANYSRLKLPSHRFSDTGLFIMKVFVWHDNNEIDTLIKNILITFYPKAEFSINDNLQCFNGNYFLFHDTSTIPTGKLSWEWDFGDTKKSNVQHPSHKYTNADSFKVTLSVISEYNCINKTSKMAYVLPSPKASFLVNDTTQCFDEQFFTIKDQSAIINDSIVQWKWFLDDSLLSSFQSFSSLTLFKSDTFSLKLLTISSQNCQDSIIHQIIVYPSPKADFIINDSNQCFNDQQFVFTNNSVIGNGQLTYFWKVNSKTYTSKDLQINNLQPKIWDVQLISTSQLGCVDTIVKAIKVFPSPKANFLINDSSQCVNEQNFVMKDLSTVNGDLITKNIWTISNNKFFNLNSLVLNQLQSGILNLKLVTFTSNNCTDSITKPLFVLSTPKAIFYVSDTVQCFNNYFFDFMNYSKGVSGTPSYKWFIDDSFCTSILNFTQFSVKKYGQYLVKLVAKDLNTCSDTAKKMVWINPSPNALFKINDTAQCINSNKYIFTNQSSISNGSLTSKLFFGDNQYSDIEPFEHIYSTDNYHVVSLVATSDKKCTDTARLKIHVLPNPKAQFSIADTDQCLETNKFVLLNSTTISYGKIFYTWNFGDSNFSPDPLPSHSYLKDSIFEISLKAVSDRNCTSSTSSKVIVFPSPKVGFIFTKPCANESVLFTDKSSIKSGSSLVAWHWILGNKNDTSLVENPTFIFKNGGIYIVTHKVWSDKGCMSSILKKIKVNEIISKTR